MRGIKFRQPKLAPENRRVTFGNHKRANSKLPYHAFVQKSSPPVQ